MMYHILVDQIQKFVASLILKECMVYLECHVHGMFHLNPLLVEMFSQGLLFFIKYIVLYTMLVIYGWFYLNF